MDSIHHFSVRQINGRELKLEEFKGKVMLLVNVASKCGLTPQYEGLENLYKKYRDQGLMVMGFPANEFAEQEPGSNAEIQEFCRMNYGVEFPLFEKIVVKGNGQHPLYQHLISAQPKAIQKTDGKLMAILKDKGLLSGEAKDISWNFEKFLVSGDGKVVARFAPDIAPEDPLLIAAIEKELAQ